MMVDGSLGIIGADERNISISSLLQTFSYDLNILDFLENEEDNPQIDRFGCEVLPNGKPNGNEG